MTRCERPMTNREATGGGIARHRHGAARTRRRRVWTGVERAGIVWLRVSCCCYWFGSMVSGFCGRWNPRGGSYVVRRSYRALSCEERARIVARVKSRPPASQPEIAFWTIVLGAVYGLYLILTVV